ncbi:hypothetical protein GDO78_009115 [Eleutherodactylus coqui]|uniref:BEN domain-containing protein 5 n=1 Tax=Eleutherodactylus coqui TaxID=57060 RepID=A0A8J6F8H6_ELECQ|nr:hypothetical protein GDO78_009115 [Eleutherodactylus coqui]
MFALVRFLEDNVCRTVPAARVPGLLPRCTDDFDKRKVYTVYREEEEAAGRTTLQRALILALAENKTDLESHVMQKKIKIPKLCVNSSEGSWEFKENEEEENGERRHSKRPDGRKQVEGTRKSIEAVVARLEKQNNVTPSHNSGCEDIFLEPCSMAGHMDTLDDALIPRVLYEELLRSYQQQQVEMRHIQHELERTRRQLVQQAKKLKDYGTLVTEVKELRVLNRRLQDVLLLRLGSEKVHLGSGVWVNEEKWHQLQATQGDSKYTKNLAVMIWGTDVLKNRSVTGVATKKKKDASPKPPLSPHKLSVIRECVYDRIAQETMDENEIAQRLSKVNKYICEKIMDINKSCKNEERKEAKFSLQ